MMKILKIAAFIVGALGTIIGGAYAVEQHYATQVQLAGVSEDLAQHKISGALYDNRKETWQYQDRLKVHPEDTTAKERLRQLEYEKQQLEMQQQKINKGGVK